MSSHHVNSWVLDHSEAKAGERLVLLSLASFCATEDWEAFPSMKTIAEHCRMSERGVRYALRSLEAAGRLLRKGVSQYDTTIYQIRTDAQADVDDRRKRLKEPADFEGEESSPRKNATEIAPQIAPEPEVEPESSVSQSTAQEPLLEIVPDPVDEIVVDARALLAAKKKVDRKIVTAAEMDIAVAAVKAWNAAAGQSLSLAPHLTPIVMRAREHPSWDAAKFERLVASAWRLRWWEKSPRSRPGRVSMGVVFGEKAFENVAQDAMREARGEPQVAPVTGRYVRTAEGKML